ncbi:MAG: diaminopimelate epimerase, partial [Clostridia bacterium]|nr:diaminopimelate epimerase [Clostridia bacterium]
MCGNGIRCVGKYLYDNHIVNKKDITVETLSGIKQLKVITRSGEAIKVEVNMGKAELAPKQIPVNLKGDKVVDCEIQVDGSSYNITCVSMGNPHCVVFVPHVDNLKIDGIGSAIENSPLFPERVNVEFVKVIDSNTLKMRVWERGSGETSACGTGACAAVVAAVLNGHCSKGQDVTVKLLGGDLTVNYTDEAVRMTGSAVKVFDGQVEI